MAWSRRFEDPIPLPDGGELVTLEDAAGYIQRLPKKEQGLPHWQTAVRELLLSADRGGIIFLARAAMLQALHHGRPAPSKPARRKAVKKNRIIR